MSLILKQTLSLMDLTTSLSAESNSTVGVILVILPHHKQTTNSHAVIINDTIQQKISQKHFKFNQGIFTFLQFHDINIFMIFLRPMMRAFLISVCLPFFLPKVDSSLLNFRLSLMLVLCFLRF